MHTLSSRHSQMDCTSAATHGSTLLHSTVDGAQQLQQQQARPAFHLRHSDFSRRKLRSKHLCTASSLPAGHKQRDLQIGHSPPVPQQSLQSSVSQQKPLFAAAAGLALALVLLFRAFSNKSSVGRKQSAEGLQDSDPELTADSKDFKIAVARTRQAVSVQKAIGFMDASSPAKAIVELRRALEENSVARASILNMRHQNQDLLNLYKLHLQNTEMPANFATLLQLREMLAISAIDAERIEKDVYESGAAFSI